MNTLESIALRRLSQTFSWDGSSASPPPATTTVVGLRTIRSITALALAAIAAALTPTASAAPVRVGTYSGTSLGEITHIQVRGDYAYLAVNSPYHTLRVLDVSAPTAPRIVGTSSSLVNYGGAQSVALAGDYAYVSCGGHFEIANISLPVRPFGIGWKDVNCKAAAVVGDYAYAGNTILDVSAPTTPVAVGLLAGASSSGVSGMAVQSNFLYVSQSGQPKLMIYDITAPANPDKRGQINVYIDGGLGVVVSGTTAYVADDVGLTAVDVSDPSFPVNLGTLVTAGHLQSVAMAKGGRYVVATDRASSFARLNVFDVSDPRAIVLTSSVTMNLRASSKPCRVAVRDDYAYVAWDTGFEIYKLNLKSEQTITFPALPDVTQGHAPLSLTATAASGLPVSFTLVSGPASLEGNTLTLTGAGTVTVRAEQAGNSDYAPATAVVQSFQVLPAARPQLRVIPSGGLLISGTTGASYQVQSCAELSQPNWTTVGTITLTNSTQTWTDRRSPLPKTRFYRLRQL